MLDLLIRGGLVVDGSGAPAQRADIGIVDGRVRTTGNVKEPAREQFDATGLVVAPGFVDVHTHYDAQSFWDPAISPSCFQGVTTIIGGNCGFSIAPLSEEAGPYLMRMLSQVEGIPLESLRQGVPWNWESFGDYLDQHEGRLALNSGFLVGHSALRRVVMGERAVGEEATTDDVAAMVALLRESLVSGGLGFSSSRAVTHRDLEGQPVPSRFATANEVTTLARVVRDYPGTVLEVIPGVGIFSEDEMDLMTELSLAGNRPINWNVLSPSSTTKEITAAQLSASDRAARAGARVVALTLPLDLKFRINLRSGFVFDVIPGWAEVLALPLDERLRALSQPAIRDRLRKGAESDEMDPFFRSWFQWDRMRVIELFEKQNKPLEGLTLGEVGRRQDKSAFDVLLDLALSEGLRPSFAPVVEVGGDDDESWRLRAQAWSDPRTVIGGSDAGAHLDTTDAFTFTSAFLGEAVRERELLSLEQAVHQITDVPARLYGLRERGRIQEGWHADLVLFDAERIRTGAVHTRFDLPAEAGRLFAKAEGIERVYVNGIEIVREQELTGRFPGTVLRSGRDTETVELQGTRGLE